MWTPSLIHTAGNTLTVLTLFILFTALDNHVQHPSWTVTSESLVTDHTCGGRIFSPHASNCHKYYLCQFGTLIEQTCPAGLYWNKVNCTLICNKLPVVAVIGRKPQRSVSYQFTLIEYQVLLFVITAVWKDQLCPNYMPVWAQRAGGDRVPTHLQPGSRRRWWWAPHYNCFAQGKDPVPILLEAGWVLGPVWRAWKILPPLGFYFQTVQSVAAVYK